MPWGKLTMHRGRLPMAWGKLTMHWGRLTMAWGKLTMHRVKLRLPQGNGSMFRGNGSMLQGNAPGQRSPRPDRVQIERFLCYAFFSSLTTEGNDGHAGQGRRK